VNTKSATTTDVNVSGAAGNITVDGGKNIVVTDSTANNAITIGAGTVNAAPSPSPTASKATVTSRSMAARPSP